VASFHELFNRLHDAVMQHFQQGAAEKDRTTVSIGHIRRFRRIRRVRGT
jgi:hypothetical protein